STPIGEVTTTESTPIGEVTTTESTPIGEVTTTESTPIETTAVVTAVKSVYVKADTTYAFYYNTEKAFDKAQIKGAELHIVYEKWTEDATGAKLDTTTYEETKDISGSVDFATTPDKAYTTEQGVFLYNISLAYTGEAINDAEGKAIISAGDLLKNEDGSIASAQAYIGMKGDTNLDKIVDSRDASAILIYYVTSSTEGQTADTVKLTTSELADSASSVYDQFAAFLSDVKFDKETSRYAKKSEKTIDSRDASAILSFYARSMTEQYSEMAKNDADKLWDIATGKTVEEQPAEEAPEEG
ncbi:MAG: hypothetical protein MJ100_04320, partial [Ruminococcus sp.]|nr:hypothetical protein [Ruminococcus sp.]